MALYHLDPRRAGTGAEADVETYSAFGGARIAAAFAGKVTYADTEQAALRAAREAAGFGHVADEPCGAYVLGYVPACDCPRRDDREEARGLKPHTSRCASRSIETRNGECITCAWPRDAHRSVTP